MQAIVAITLPFFALVLLGWVAGRRGWVPGSAVPGLNGYVLFFALPAMLFRAGQGLPVADLLAPARLLVLAIVGMALVALAIGWSRRQGVDRANAAFGSLVAAFPNSGFMGIPLMLALIGPAANGPVIASMLVDMFITSSVALTIAQWDARGGGSHLATFGRALKAPLGNPMPWSIALGALFSWQAWQLPGPVARLVGMLADSASPVALFTIGAVLARAAAQAKAGEIEHGPRADVLGLVALKLLAHPLLMAAALTAARGLGMTLQPLEFTTLVLTAALPSASNVALLTERFGADTARVVRVILWSTVIAFASFTAAAHLLGVRPA